MSMLAERKRKAKWVINPSKKPLWTTDSDGLNFGKNLMEKMGWSPGKGLGIQEQGIQEPLKIAFKNDTKGIGCKGNDEVWIECQDEFNNLLNELANTNNELGLKSSEKQNVNEVKSLEEKSKQSKARVHYQKFLRGKDLAKYSENDLACILGMSQNKKPKDTEKKHVELKDSEDKCEKSFGVTTINGGSLQDYLKKKWHTYKSKNQTNQSSEEENTPTIASDLVNNTGILEGDDKKKRKYESVDIFCNKEECFNENGELNYDELSDEMGKHKKKKKALKLIGDYDNIILKKKKDDIILNEYVAKSDSKDEIKECEEFECLSKNLEWEPTKENFENKKRKRKSKEIEKIVLEINEDENLEEKEKINCSKKKKKKKKKSKEIDYDSEKEVSSNKFSEEINIILNKKDETNCDNKKKKKKKNDLDEEVINSITFLNETVKTKSGQENEYHHSKRKKKEEKTNSVCIKQIKIDNSEKSITAPVSLSKNNDTNLDIIDIKDTTEVDSKEKKHKRKKPMDLKSNLEVDTNLFQSTEEYGKKKKSKKSKTKKVKKTCEDSLVFNLSEVAEEQKAENTELSLEANNQLLKIDNDSQSKLQTKKNENVVYSHKKELFKKKKPNAYPQYNKRFLQLSFGFEVHKFKGSNLIKLAGYGMKNNEKIIKAR